MSVKFVSKNSNFMVVLKPGIPGSVITGQQPVAGIYVRFQGGAVDVHEENIIEMLRANKDFGTNFVEIKQHEKDPYNHTRTEIEPIHNITEIKYGHVEGKTASAKIQVLSPEVKKLIESEAVKMLPDLLKKNPKILKDILQNLAKEASIGEKQEGESVGIKEEEIKRGPGRPAKEEIIKEN